MLSGVHYRAGSWRVPIILLSVVLSGCTWLESWSNRYGPDPILDPVKIAKSDENQSVVLAILIQRAGINPVVPSSDWYYVMEAGFNYVDEQCDVYLRSLSILNRERDRIKNILIAGDKASSAALSAASASAKAIVIVAQSFGLGEGIADAVANSYLYQLDPAGVLNVVNELRSTYRKVAYAAKSKFIAPTTAYQGVQRYLMLCLPPTIEAKIATLVTNSKGQPKLDGLRIYGATPIIDIGLSSNLQ